MKKSPKVSCVLIAYNQRKFVVEAVLGLLTQDYDEPMEIVLSDDASTDGTFELMRDIVAGYDGPYRIKLNRNEKNLGIVDHFNRALELSSGDLIIPAAGDDVSLPNRIGETVDFWTQNGRPSAISLNPTMIDERGLKLGPFLTSKDAAITAEGFFSPAGGGGRFLGAIGREVIAQFGPLSASVRNEDDQILFRAALLNGVGILRQSVLLYRQHRGNFSIAAKMRGASDEEWLQLRTEAQRNLIALSAIQKDCLSVAFKNSWISRSEYLDLEKKRSLYEGFLMASNSCLTNGLQAVSDLRIIFRPGLGIKRRASLLLSIVSKWLYIRLLKVRTTRAHPDL